MILPVKKGYFFVRLFQPRSGNCSWPLPKFYSSRGDTGRQFYGGAVMRVKVTLRCSECKQRNYNSMKNKKNDPDRLEMKKYCRFCRKHTIHNETK